MRNFEILGFSHLEFEILVISSEIPSISKTWNFDYKAGTEKIIISLACFCLLQIFGLELRQYGIKEIRIH